MDLIFQHKYQESNTIWSFYFSKPSALVFEAGDYVDVELNYGSSELGGRRWLTISSSPHHPHVRFTLKFPPQPSQFKQALMNLHAGQTVQVSPPIGTFHLPRKQEQKVLWIAGGIGITPYLSKSELLVANKESRDITCLYYAKTTEHIYRDLLSSVSHVRLLADRQQTPLHLVDDYAERHIYLSGPETFCMEYYTQFHQAGVDRHQLHLDYFPGYDLI